MNYIATEIARMRKVLLRTQIASACVVVLGGGYLIYITNHFASSLAPVEAAGIANSLIDQKVDEQSAMIADYAKKQVPILISQAPDYVLKSEPGYRKEIEDRINKQFQTFASGTKDKFGESVDKLLDGNKDAVASLLKNGGDAAATAVIVKKLNALFHEHLTMAQVDGESIQQKLNSALDSLTKVDERMKRLAVGKNLSSSELGARRAIAVLLKNIDDKKVDEGVTGPLVKLQP